MKNLKTHLLIPVALVCIAACTKQASLETEHVKNSRVADIAAELPRFSPGGDEPLTETQSAGTRVIWIYSNSNRQILVSNGSVWYDGSSWQLPSGNLYTPCDCGGPPNCYYVRFKWETPLGTCLHDTLGINQQYYIYDTADPNGVSCGLRVELRLEPDIIYEEDHVLELSLYGQHCFTGISADEYFDVSFGFIY